MPGEVTVRHSATCKRRRRRVVRRCGSRRLDGVAPQVRGAVPLESRRRWWRWRWRGVRVQENRVCVRSERRAEAGCLLPGRLLVFGRVRDCDADGHGRGHVAHGSLHHLHHLLLLLLFGNVELHNNIVMRIDGLVNFVISEPSHRHLLCLCRALRLERCLSMSVDGVLPSA